MYGIWTKHWKDGCREYSEDELEVKEKYFARFKEIQDQNEIKRIQIMSEIGKILPRLWD